MRIIKKQKLNKMDLNHYFYKLGKAKFEADKDYLNHLQDKPINLKLWAY